MIGQMAVPSEQEQDSGRVFTLTVERLSLPRQCVDGESPRGGGADGEGAERPFPCLLHLNQTLRFHVRQATPTTRPRERLAIDPVAVPWAETQRVSP